MNLADLMRAGDDAAAGHTPISEIGVVVSVIDSRQVTVNTAGVPETMTLAQGVTAAVGSSVVVMRTRQCPVVIASIPQVAGTETAPVDPVEAADAGGVSHFPAVATYSWQSGAGWSPESIVRQGDNGSGAWVGAWFYTALDGASGDTSVGYSTLSGATATSARVKLQAAATTPPGSVSLHLSAPGYFPTGGTDPASPIAPIPAESAGLPLTITTPSITVPLLAGDATWVTLPLQWAQLMIDGWSRGVDVDPGGLGLMITAASPYVELAGVDVAPESGLLEITWTT